MAYYNRRDKGILQAALAGLQAGADPSFVMSLVNPTISGAAERRQYQQQYGLGLQEQLFSLAAQGAPAEVTEGFLEAQQSQLGFLNQPRVEDSLQTVLDSLYASDQGLSPAFTEPMAFQAALEQGQAAPSLLDDPAVWQSLRQNATAAIEAARQAGEVPSFQNVFWGTTESPGLARTLTIDLGAGTPEFEAAKEQLKAEWERLGGASPEAQAAAAGGAGYSPGAYSGTALPFRGGYPVPR